VIPPGGIRPAGTIGSAARTALPLRRRARARTGCRPIAPGALSLPAGGGSLSARPSRAGFHFLRRDGLR